MISSQGLTKKFGGRTVVQDVTFGCEPGTITGFLGPNGAGKTTTLRMLCGLSEPDAGSSAVLGGAYRALPNPGRRVGILLDASAQHPGRRGRETLALWMLLPMLIGLCGSPAARSARASAGRRAPPTGRARAPRARARRS